MLDGYGDVNLGNIILNIGFSSGIFGAILLLRREKHQKMLRLNARFFIRVFAALLTIDYLLLTYYFYTTNLTLSYVFSHTSSDLALIYKLSGPLVGLQGTYLYWAALISLSALLLSEKHGLATDFQKKTASLVLGLGAFFTGLALSDSPFTSIYDANPGLARDYIPVEGAGLNPLLQDFWMAVHPPVIFIAYAALALPFAAAVVYLFKSLKREQKNIHQEWVVIAFFWCRLSWLFLTLAIAIGGFWSYKVVGWGGFWTWDPVETSSFAAWLLLTAALHIFSEHSLNEKKHSVLSPAAVALCFSLVIYATLVTRSGFFTSIHAFGKEGAAAFLLILIGLTAVPTIILALMKYMGSTAKECPEAEKNNGLVNRSTISKASILLLISLTFVSFWGVTYPGLQKLIHGEIYGVFPAWFNIFSYIFIVPLMLLAGLCLSYKTPDKDRLIREFFIFTGLTATAMFILPGEGWNIAEYTTVLGPENPFIMSFIGSISVLSFIPPSAYVILALIRRWKNNFNTVKNRDYRIRELGITSIHLGIIFILLGAIASTAFSTEYSAGINLNDKGRIQPLEGGDFSIMLLDYSEIADYSEISAAQSQTPEGFSVRQLYQTLDSGRFPSEVSVYGRVSSVQQVQGYTYIQLSEGNQSFWVAAGKIDDAAVGSELAASGVLMTDFSSPSLGKTFEIILFAGAVEVVGGLRKELVSSTQQIEIVVYKEGERIARGTARYGSYRDNTVGQVMIHRGLTGDINVLFSGRFGDELPIKLKFVPLINWLWFGVLLFATGILASLITPKTGYSGLEEHVISKGLCTSCGVCAESCPEKAVKIDKAPILIGDCIGCGRCLENCPER